VYDGADADTPASAEGATNGQYTEQPGDRAVEGADIEVVKVKRKKKKKAVV
jgi:hypothetical protein